MIKVRYAKSAIENEEGMNHLWIQVTPVENVRNARLQISLPSGIHRLRNLNAFDENPSGEISIHTPWLVTDIFIEVFTREPVSCGEKTMAVTFCYIDENEHVTRVEHFVPLIIVTEEEIEKIIIDEEVVTQIKKLQYQNEGSNDLERIECTQAKLIRIDSNQVSEWEKKYRIEGIMH